MKDVAPGPVVSAAQFDQLLAMAGPKLAKTLVAQLRADLSLAQHTLRAAVDPVDWAEIRVQSHVMMGLAGTVGAQDLYLLARQLNDVAQLDAQDAQMATALASSTGQAIDAVVTFLSLHPCALAALA